MITLAMPTGSNYGWGICGKYIAREMAGLTELRLISGQMTAEAVGDELEYKALEGLLLTQQEAARLTTINGVTMMPGPLLTCIGDKRLGSWMPNLRGTPTAGYTFFEENVLEKAWIEGAARSFDVIATGSSWNTEVLRGYGLKNVQTVIQGIDPRVFFPWPESGAPEREFLKGKFVIFSGGKFELRKGQDIVIRAVKVLQERHADVVLVNAWFNPWPESMKTMLASPYLRPVNLAGPYGEVINRLLAENGLDLRRVVTLGARPNALMARIYRNTDVGFFSNRCEGGTNLVLMEYMACGKPVVAVNSTGHSDVVKQEHAVVVKIKGENTYNSGGVPVARWPEPDVEDAIEKLEWAYQHREELGALGVKAGAEMAGLTWTKTAREFLKVLLPA